MSDVIYIPELAARLGKTEESIRQCIKKRSTAIPPFIRMGGKNGKGGRICFRTADYEEWLKSFTIENPGKYRR